MNKKPKTPPFLQKGDKIGIVSPSGFIEKQYIDNAVDIFEAWGFCVVLGKSVFNKHTIFAGTDTERITDFQEMIDNNEIKAIVCARGGYGAIRIIQQIDFKNIIESPKWLVGFSDVTIFHSALHNVGVASLHSPMPKNFETASPNTLACLNNHLMGINNYYSFLPESNNNIGNCKAKLVGGNLSILYSLLGTRYEIDTSNKILLIEDLCEKMYHIERMMYSLDMAGKLRNLSGLIVGAFTDIYDSKPSMETNVIDIIKSITSKYKYPIAYNVPIGHIQNNHPIYLGLEYCMDVTKEGVKIEPIM